MNSTSSLNRLSWAFGSSRSASPRASTSRLAPRPPHRPLSTRPQPPSHPSDLSKNPFYVPPPGPGDIPPISERLRPLIPFLIYWTGLTSLAFHLMQVRTHTKEDLARRDAQVTVLENIVDKYQTALKRGLAVDESEVERELQMVGLRERPTRSPIDMSNEGADIQGLEEEFVEGRTITWKEVFFGRKAGKLSEEEQEDAAKAEWQEVINAASSTSKPPASKTWRDYVGLDSKMPEIPAKPTGEGRRAPSAAVYM